MSAITGKTVNSTAEGRFPVRRTLLVLVLLFMLSSDPAVGNQQLRVERTPVEYVVPGRRKGLRGRRGRVPLRFTSIESTLSLQG